MLPLVLAVLLAISPERQIAPATIATGSADSARISLATDGDQFFAVWTSGHNLVGMRTDAEGKPLDVLPRAIAARVP